MPLDIQTILAPAVIAAIVSAIVTFVVNYRKQSLDFITAERSPWRLRIKAAMQELVKNFGNEKKTELALQKIKSEINPYGMDITERTVIVKKRKNKSESEYNETYYLKDAHIWNAIADYENNYHDQQRLNVLLKQLEFMLKYDWERSKGEVIGINKYIIVSLLSCVFSAICMLIPTIETQNTISSDMLLTVTFIFIAIAILPYWVFTNKSAKILASMIAGLWMLMTLLLLWLYYSHGENMWYLFSLIFLFMSMFFNAPAIDNSGERKKIMYIKAASKIMDSVQEVNHSELNNKEAKSRL